VVVGAAAAKNELQKALNGASVASFNKYLKYGARSNKKTLPLHEGIKDIFINSGKSSRIEEKVEGEFNFKTCDVVVDGTTVGKPEGIVSVKFPLSNYKQNATNYFENSTGETANLRLADIKVGHFILLPVRLPYLNKKGKVTKIEQISDRDIDKYRKLMKTNSLVTPDGLFLQLIDPWGSRIRVGRCAPKKPITHMPFLDASGLSQLSKENVDFLNEFSDAEKFFSVFSF
jgi:hypothetical protein